VKYEHMNMCNRP